MFALLSSRVTVSSSLSPQLGPSIRSGAQSVHVSTPRGRDERNRSRSAFAGSEHFDASKKKSALGRPSPPTMTKNDGSFQRSSVTREFSEGEISSHWVESNHIRMWKLRVGWRRERRERARGEASLASSHANIAYPRLPQFPARGETTRRNSTFPLTPPPPPDLEVDLPLLLSSTGIEGKKTPHPTPVAYPCPC